tara:strand:+ start:1627 stop:1950 length:324 start_codon:yes stop_codon:yes gene_type:complete
MELVSDKLWVTKYDPIPNPIDPNGERSYYSIDGVNLSWETYGPELEIVNAVDVRNVWTLIENEGVRSIIHGRRRVNKVAYFVCSVPYNPNDTWEDRPGQYAISDFNS